MVAFAVLLVSATLAAVSVTTCMLVIVGGAMYKPPALTEPRLGLRLLRTGVLLVFANRCIELPSQRWLERTGERRKRDTYYGRQ